ncbi:MAG: hypothetical protein M0P20_03130 [Methanocorpusculum sp.]|nr:hypothetical protein [Methanocorpusculum sp.]
MKRLYIFESLIKGNEFRCFQCLVKIRVQLVNIPILIIDDLRYYIIVRHVSLLELLEPFLIRATDTDGHHLRGV